MIVQRLSIPRCYSKIPILIAGVLSWIINLSCFLWSFFVFYWLLTPVCVYAGPVPEEMRSSAFTVKVNGQEFGVAHAAASYQIVSVDVTGRVDIEITGAKLGPRSARRQKSEMAEKRGSYSETGVWLS